MGAEHVALPWWFHALTLVEHSNYYNNNSIFSLFFVFVWEKNCQMKCFDTPQCRIRNFSAIWKGQTPAGVSWMTYAPVYIFKVNFPRANAIFKKKQENVSAMLNSSEAKKWKEEEEEGGGLLIEMELFMDILPSYFFFFFFFPFLCPQPGEDDFSKECQLHRAYMWFELRGSQ